ncbi:baseplate J/gp47 family protein [Larkinella rosea]|uniref:Uncharacterized protein n=1 Tax=Larkinella rosea TaxID=2025312 RepID=A0A3P1C3A8_9BACT|nr:baseplate J/gp47 family protein [Larkinella rosea]RRB07762.1 hypothetical protein EHT25_08305 [Larkinella rosea]
MSTLCHTPHPLTRQGTAQTDRLPEGLKSGFVDLDERTLTNLVRQSAEYSRYIGFYDGVHADPSARADWTVFFEQIYDFSTKRCRFSSIDELKTGEISPHLGLFLAFLQLFQINQSNLNELTDKHISLFYEDVLQLAYKPTLPDKAVIFTTLAKSQESLLLKSGTRLLAGKDGQGNPRVYKTTEEVVVNQAQVTDLKTVFVQKNGGEIQHIALTQKADTADGISKPIESEPASWDPFGNGNQPKAEIGCLIASPIFYLSEGNRTITLSAGNFPAELADQLTIQYTAPKGWQEVSSWELPGGKLVITLAPALPAWVGFDPEKHGDRFFDTVLPLLKISLKDHAQYRLLQQNKPDITIDVSVTGCKNLLLYNDLGEIDPSKSFLPFGTRPVPNSSKLIIGYPSAFNKYLKNFALVVNENPALSNSVVNFSQAFPLVGGVWQAAFPGDRNNYNAVGVFKNDYSQDEADLSYSTQTKNNFIRVINQYDYAKALASYTQFIAETAGGGSTSSKATTTASTVKIKDKIAERATDVSKEAILIGTYIEVNPPVIPEYESLTLHYNASVSLKNDAASFFYQIHPFGYQKFNKTVPPNLMPEFGSEGTLYIGISRLLKGQSLSLHFQLLESSGNPDLKINGITWFTASNNSLVRMAPHEIIKDTTGQLTTSGIIRFSLPPEAFENRNTVLDSNKVWLVARCEQDCAAYPRVIAIKSQAVESTFFNQNNETAHLTTGLEAGTITKVELPLSGLKKIEQPYVSTGGRSAESVSAYRTRVSELLRHKSRAWNIWDYERMVLEEFPEIYKVKCISHSKSTTEYAPGNVLLVVLPHLEDVQTQDLLQPKVSIGKREEIRAYLQKFVSPFVKIEVINPVYEALEVTAHVTLIDGFDKAYYADQVSKALKAWLSPWLKSREEGLTFRGELYQSDLINFIEQLAYVDYIGFLEVRTYVNGAPVLCGEHIKTSSQSVILTSSATHVIDTDKPC